uniref:phage antirepressor KilAC domain-containing protein n=1 Tax=Prevotella sp. TaxID=59823 RepID=UPI004029074B
MNELKIINKSTFLDKEIDVWGTVEQPLFRAKDVASWLGIKNVPDLVKRIDNEEVHRLNLCGLQGETWFLTEDGLYELLMQSRKPIAKQFKKGVKKILHEIRTKGGYIATNENDSDEDIMARAYVIAQRTLARREERIRQLETQTEQQAETINLQKKELTVAAPKAEYYDKTLASTTCITTTQVADDLHITARTLNAKLKDLGIIYSQSGQWHLKMPYKGWNLAGTRTYNYQSSNGETLTSTTLVWNQRGKRFIIALYNNDFNVKRAIAELAGDNKNK